MPPYKIFDGLKDDNHILKSLINIIALKNYQGFYLTLNAKNLLPIKLEVVVIPITIKLAR